ncbi:DUF1804 family protein [Tumebacillus sp. ITR2]|uniref:DUF1804 family protein n=1 Tax=Tumebacillus amylolyticus TaxID=2801339 RepID=A0ABS1JCB2_9BACL|nr:phage terminase small subunit [Tumebacillus amylolyticus]MBL0387911.1 DUF1804 family protein [Tumebacillus amylolyticus]
MARERSPKWEQARQMFVDSKVQMMLKDIGEKLGVSDAQIRKWKREDKKKGIDWDALANGHVTNGANSHVTNQQPNAPPKKKPHGAPKGNDNARGNKGGNGAPRGNKFAAGNSGGGAPHRNQNAYRTGEFAAIWMDALNDNEKAMLEKVDTDPVESVRREIGLLEFREFRMMRDIEARKSGLNDKQRRVLQERMQVKEPQQVHNDRTGETSTVVVKREVMAVTQIEETEMRAIDDILAIEEALTRVQDKKIKAAKTLADLLAQEEKLAMDREKLELARKQVELAEARLDFDIYKETRKEDPDDDETEGDGFDEAGGSNASSAWEGWTEES